MEKLMRLKFLILCLLCSALFLSATSVLGQSDAEKAALRLERYELGASYNEITEAAFRFTGLSSKERATVAIRVCSKEPISLALAMAAADPFQIADKFVNGYAYRPDQVMFLRSVDCLSPKDSSVSATELWAIPQGALLPPYIEAFESNQINRISLGKEPSNRGVRDYKAALHKLIENLQANPANTGVIFGYFLERPSPILQQRVRGIAKLLEQSGLPRNHYLVRLAPWPDEVSTYPPDSEPTYPSVFIIEAAKDCKRK